MARGPPAQSWRTRCSGSAVARTMRAGCGPSSRQRAACRRGRRCRLCARARATGGARAQDDGSRPDTTLPLRATRGTLGPHPVSSCASVSGRTVVTAASPRLRYGSQSSSPAARGRALRLPVRPGLRGAAAPGRTRDRVAGIVQRRFARAAARRAALRPAAPGVGPVPDRQPAAPGEASSSRRRSGAR
jgi:hypothetical protein